MQFEEALAVNKKAVPCLDKLAIRVETNKTLLKPEFKLYLNPVMLVISDIEVFLKNITTRTYTSIPTERVKWRM